MPPDMILPQARTPAETKARDYFWPDGYWAGYSRFFSPALPQRLGCNLLRDISDGLRHHNKMALLIAVAMLRQNQVKVVAHVKGVKPVAVTCVPTDAAAVAVTHLTAVIEELNHAAECDNHVRAQPDSRDMCRGELQEADVDT